VSAKETRRVLEAALARALGESVQVLELRTLGGGSINRAVELVTEQGSFFAKTNDGLLPGLFETEARGLEALRSADSGLRIPRVLAAGEKSGHAPAYLITEFLAQGHRVADFDRRLGEGLARLHQLGAERFGFEQDNYCGATSQPNEWTQDWIDFYARQRIGHQLKLASRSRLLSAGEEGDIERFLERLPMLLAGAEESPALIHGDLWSGNLMVDEAGNPGLIDPAAYFGHREAELGMMKLFGGFASGVYEAYDRAYPLAPGWQERNPIYQLYHVMNHLNLFGAGYLGQTLSIVRRYL